MSEKKYRDLLEVLHSDLASQRDISNFRPILVHYTSIRVLEEIAKKREFWMSNPVNMNDYMEVRAGLDLATQSLLTSTRLEDALGSPEKFIQFNTAFAKYSSEYGATQALDLYVGCFSEHTGQDLRDGKLSMWRGYGDQGNGVAIVIDTNKLRLSERSPLILAEVHYLDKLDRQKYVEQKIEQLSQFVEASNISGGEVHMLAHAFFRRALLASIFSKHEGFKEEKEWRIVYMKENDPSREVEPMLSYFNGPRGMEPKLKLKLLPKEPLFSAEFSLEDCVSNVILGPRANTMLSKFATQRMLGDAGLEDLAQKVIGSTIPFRG